MTDAINSVFWCPQCGEGVTADEDDCCGSCGAMLVTETVLHAIAAAARAQGAEEALRAAASTAIHACAALVRLTAPDGVDEAHVPREAVVDIAMAKRSMRIKLDAVVTFDRDVSMFPGADNAIDELAAGIARAFGQDVFMHPGAKLEIKNVRTPRGLGEG